MAVETDALSRNMLVNIAVEPETATMHARLDAFAIALTIVVAALLPAAADDKYPSRPITLIVPFPAGGGVDAMGRIVADKLSAALGQQVVVDNKGGAAGVIGTRLAAKAAPDGYTLVMATSGTTLINPTLYANPGYDPRKDFAPIGLIASTPIVLMAHPSAPAKTVTDLIALAKAQPGRLDAGTPPPGTENYMAAVLFKAEAGVDLTIVPYKGTGPLTTDLIGGHIKYAFNTLPPAVSNIQAGQLRAMAVAATARVGILPEVPTVAESGLPGFEAVVYYGLLAPAGTPSDIVARINKELRNITALPEIRARIVGEGGEVLSSSPEEYAANIDRGEAKWSALIRRLGLKVE
jgi:tripartite-type tricarboxylate transporter receptor subunit TctC